MAKILITTIPYWGHINVTLSVGTLLIERGHDVVWAIAKDMPGLAIPDGGRLFLSNNSEDKVLNDTLELLDSGKSKAAMEGSIFVIENVLLPLANMMFDGLNKIVEDFQPDLIIHDEQTYIGGICANLKKIPYITTHAAPPGVYESSEARNVVSWYGSVIGNFQGSFGLPNSPNILRSRKLGLAFCPREFADPNNLISGQVFVGPCLDVPRKYQESFDFTRLRNNDLKNVMVSIGTLLSVEAKQFYQKVINDLGNTDYNVIITADPSLFDQWPDNFIVQQRVPHLELLNDLDVVITHGGANTTCDCIGMGIPLVVVPMAFDQFYVGDQVAANGLGVRLKYRRLRAGQLLNACNSLVAKDSLYQQKAHEYSKIYRAAGGATKAASLIENFIQAECSYNV